MPHPFLQCNSYRISESCPVSENCPESEKCIREQKRNSGTGLNNQHTHREVSPRDCGTKSDDHVVIHNTNMYNNTIIIYSGDNGKVLGFEQNFEREDAIGSTV